MNNWYQVKVKSVSQQENGTFKKVSENYLINGINFTEVENRAYEEIGQMIRGEFSITGCNPKNFADVVAYDDVDYWFEGTVKFQSIEDEKSKAVTQKILVSGADISDAFDNIKENCEKFMSDYEIVGISKSSIIDVFPFRDNGEGDTIEDEILDSNENI